MPRASEVINPKNAKTIAGLFCERVRRTPSACAYLYYSAEEHLFKEITWKEVMRLAGCWQAALGRENLVPGDRVAVALGNCLEWVLFDLAALGHGLITVPLAMHDRPLNAAYILRQTGAKFVLIEEEEQWQAIEKVEGRLSGIERIVALRRVRQPNSSLDACRSAETAWTHSGVSRESPDRIGACDSSGTNSRDDPRVCALASWLPEGGGNYVVNGGESAALATIVYTSGTTGMPKGVMLSHSNILENAFACIQREPVRSEDIFLSFLPLSHTLERTAGYYIPMMAGACVAHVRSIDKLSEDLMAVRPTVIISVPRIFERIHKKVAAELEEKPLPVRHLFHLATDVGWKRFLCIQGRRKWIPLLLLWPLLKRFVADRVMAGFGGRLRLSISGGAPLAFPVAKVFIGLGLNLLQGYGLTEASPVISVNTTDDNAPDTVGRPLPGIESKIATDGELLVRGPNVMLGYWHSREATEAAIDPDGYLHTGDLATLDEAGRIAIVGRIKEITVLSTGEKISPADIELAVATNPLFEQVMVVGENRPYLAALVVLNRSIWGKLAAKHGIAFDWIELSSYAPVEKLLLSEIAQTTAQFPDYAQIRRVHATVSPWGIQDGLITATLKLRRIELLKRFKREVESLFKGH